MMQLDQKQKTIQPQNVYFVQVVIFRTYPSFLLILKTFEFLEPILKIHILKFLIYLLLLTKLFTTTKHICLSYTYKEQDICSLIL